MRHVTTFFATAACVGAIFVSGCARSRGARGASDLPAAFVPIVWNTAAPAREGCAIRLRDERDGTTLLLRRSESRQVSTREGDATVTRYLATGDYEVLTPGRYGLSASQWLRVNCTTWRPVGPVPRTS